MKKRILLLTDSVSLPRTKPEYCEYSDTWGELIKKDGFTVYQVSIGGATSGDLLRQADYYTAFNPEYVIVQVGIVDCAPRFLTRTELLLLRKLGLFGRMIIKLLSTPTIRKIRRISYVTPKKFQQNVLGIIKKFSNSEVFFIEILPTSDSYEKALPGISKKIDKYNRILRTTNMSISLDGFDKAGIMSDHHHLNKAGHLDISKIVLKHIN